VIRFAAAFNAPLLPAEAAPMPWFRHHYSCEGCEGHWLAEAASALAADCPFCATRDIFPYKSDDWTLIIEREGKAFAVLEAAVAESSHPNYRLLKTFAKRKEAEAYIADRLTSLAKTSFAQALERLQKSA
jgi:hypothetical protein